MLQNFLNLIERGNYLVFDTETTGLRGDDEICQLAVIDDTGAVLMDTLIKPNKLIPGDATAIHGISNEMVQDAPDWGYISPRLERLLKERNVIVYNAKYDRMMMHQSASAAGMPRVAWSELAMFTCAMEAYAEFYGDWNGYHGSYRWQPLSKAAAHLGIPVLDAHDALGDCRMTLAVCRAMAASRPESISK